MKRSRIPVWRFKSCNYIQMRRLHLCDDRIKLSDSGEIAHAREFASQIGEVSREKTRGTHRIADANAGLSSAQAGGSSEMV